MPTSQLPKSLSLTQPSENRKQPPSKEFLARIEGYAHAIRKRAGVAELLDRFDPFDVAERLGVLLMDLDAVGGLPEEAHERIRALDAKEWSGGARPLPDDRLLVILNPNQTRERARITLIEEIAHHYLGHKPSQIAEGPAGLPERSYDPKAEQEAYWTAGAVLLPRLVVARAVYRCQSAEELGAAYGASTELAEMRIKILGLWRPYNSKAAAEELATAPAP